MRRVITDAEFWREFITYERSAWRFEQQPSYSVGYEREQFDDFLAGRPKPPTDNPELGEWMAQIARQTAEGKAVGRVRIVDDPLTDYQRWLQWMDRWNREAGETIDYLSRRHAQEVGLIPQVGPEDWWFFDDSRLMLMHFNEDGVRVKVELLVDEPEVAQASRWQHLAIRAAREESYAPS
jgi:hypothetical protein